MLALLVGVDEPVPIGDEPPIADGDAFGLALPQQVRESPRFFIGHLVRPSFLLSDELIERVPDSLR